MDKNELLDILVRQMELEGVPMDKAKLRDRISKYSSEEVERAVDAFNRFGVKTMFEALEN